MHGGAGALQRVEKVAVLFLVLLHDFHSVRLVKCHMKENHISTRRQNELGRKEPESFLSCGNVCADTHLETAETAAVFWLPPHSPIAVHSLREAARVFCGERAASPLFHFHFTLPFPPKHISHGEARNRSEVCGICGQKECRAH